MVKQVAISSLSLPELQEMKGLTLSNAPDFLLTQHPEPRYGISEVLLLLPGRNVLHSVLQIIKRLGEQMIG
ncbi:MAG: hypothetical protein AAF728_08605 [Cyanobacteria bacterium P01_D01_bin.128]